MHLVPSTTLYLDIYNQYSLGIQTAGFCINSWTICMESGSHQASFRTLNTTEIKLHHN